jgi:hypothetical protein
MHFILIHGYKDRSAGAKNIDKLRPYLEALGHTVDCDSADYGWFGLWWIRFRKHSAVLRIVKAFLIHPALPSKAKFPEVVSRVWVAITKSDWVVRLATFTSWFTGWGRMGRRGYRGDDPRVKNLDYTDVAKGHGGTFKDEIVEWFAAEIHREVTQ